MLPRPGGMTRLRVVPSESSSTEDSAGGALQAASASRAQALQPGAECSSDSEGSGSSASSGDTPIVFNIKPGIAFQQSVYEAALVAPLIFGITRKRMCTFSFLLVVNMAVQFMVLVKINFLSGAVKTKQNYKLFEICKHTVASELYLAEPNNASSPLWDCTPFDVSGAHLDADGDGNWSLQDVEQRQAEWKAHPYKWSSLHTTWERMIRKARAGELLAQEGVAAPSAGGIDMAWLRREESHISLCTVANPDLCANLEARDILAPRFPNHLSIGDRIDLCEQIIGEYCPKLFGERFKLYKVRVDELCGATSVKWLEEKGIRAVVYEMSDRYDNIGDGIIRPQYIWFLYVIFMVWLLVMWKEFREIWSWCVILPFFPSCPEECKNGDEKMSVELKKGIFINWMPPSHKAWAICLIFIPRLVIMVCLTICGNRFLANADSYTELILNSVALGFLIEVDNMLYAAVISEGMKHKLDKVERLTLDDHRRPIQRNTLKVIAGDSLLSCLDMATRACHMPYTSIVQILFIILLPGVTVLYYYKEPGGKLDLAGALNCLCQASGHHCAAANLLRGQVHLPDYNTRGFLAISM